MHLLNLHSRNIYKFLNYHLFLFFPISEAIQSIFSAVTDSDIEEQLRRALKDAKDRCGGRRNRKSQQDASNKRRRLSVLDSDEDS